MGNKFLERSFGKYPQFFRSFDRQSIFETCSGVRKWHFQVEKPAEVQEKKFFQRASQVKVRGQKLHKILWVPAQIAKWFRPENHETFWWRLLLMWGGHKWLCQGWPTFPATIAGLATNKVSFCILFIKNHLSALFFMPESWSAWSANHCLASGRYCSLLPPTANVSWQFQTLEGLFKVT